MSHWMQVVAPGWLLIHPGSQSRQDAAPRAAWNFPAGHCEQPVPSAEKKPASHKAQLAAPACLFSVPGLHGWHALRSDASTAG